MITATPILSFQTNLKCCCSTGVQIASYNINGINGRLTNLLRWLEEAEPDVVCLQELKCTDEAFPEKVLLEFGYHVIWHGQQSWNGVAILSRYGEIKQTRLGLDGDPGDTHSRYIEGVYYGDVDHPISGQIDPGVS